MSALEVPATHVTGQEVDSGQFAISLRRVITYLPPSETSAGLLTGDFLLRVGTLL